MEQRKKQFCLIIYGTMVQRNNDFSEVDSFIKERCRDCRHYTKPIPKSCVKVVRVQRKLLLMIFRSFFQEKMRDLAEKLFNTRCGVMVEKVKSITNYNNTRGG